MKKRPSGDGQKIIDGLRDALAGRYRSTVVMLPGVCFGKKRCDLRMVKQCDLCQRKQRRLRFPTR